MKKYSTSLAILEIYIKTEKWDMTSYLLGCLSSTEELITSVGKNMEEL